MIITLFFRCIYTRSLAQKLAKKSAKKAAKKSVKVCERKNLVFDLVFALLNVSSFVFHCTPKHSHT